MLESVKYVLPQEVAIIVLPTFVPLTGDSVFDSIYMDGTSYAIKVSNAQIRRRSGGKYSLASADRYE
jgi:hypothetical protein